MTTTLDALQSWVDQVAAHTQPEAIHWCSGSGEEYRDLIELMLAHGTLTALNPKTHPNCYLHLSDPNDVARVEHLTFVCTEEEDDAGPNNLWMPPADAHQQMDALFEGCMRGRIMYVIPYCMGPIDSRYSMSSPGAKFFVPLKFMCSLKCAMPRSCSVSCTEPTRIASRISMRFSGFGFERM